MVSQGRQLKRASADGAFEKLMSNRQARLRLGIDMLVLQKGGADMNKTAITFSSEPTRPVGCSEDRKRKGKRRVKLVLNAQRASI